MKSWGFKEINFRTTLMINNLQTFGNAHTPQFFIPCVSSWEFFNRILILKTK